LKLYNRDPNPSDVTPELAIYVVRNFILPMFETEGKRILRNKVKNGRDPSKDVGGSSSVYNELKLSEMLSD
jgi:hypothetical protein